MQARASGRTLAYITRTFVQEKPYMQAARAEGERRRPGMQVSSYEGHLLQWLVAISGAKNILEIGTFMGTSTLWLAEGLGEGGRITALEFDKDSADAARTHVAASPHAANIEIVNADAHAWLASTPATPTYDLVFIDAEKSGYAAYLDAALLRLKPRGWIIGDNTLLFGAMAGEETETRVSAAAKASMTRFNETLADASRFESILLPTPEGLTVARLK